LPAEVILMSNLLLLTCLIDCSVMMTCLQSISEHDKKADDDDSDDEYRKKKTKKGDVAYAEYLASLDPTLKPSPPPPPDDNDAIRSLVACDESDRKPAAKVSIVCSTLLASHIPWTFLCILGSVIVCHSPLAPTGTRGTCKGGT
jgi:hypothetical protein